MELKSWNVLESTYDHRVESINWQKYLNSNTTTTTSNATSTNNNNSITFTNGRNIIIPTNITTNINNTNIMIPDKVSRILAARTCSRTEVKLGLCEPFNDTQEYGHILLTLGYLITAAVFLPICLKDLKENTAWQIFGFGLLVSLSTWYLLLFMFHIGYDRKKIIRFDSCYIMG